MYRYLNHPRLQLFFISPNICAAWLVMLIILLFGIAHKCLLRKQRKSTVVAYCLFSVVFVFSCLLGMTYSRGGFVSLLLSMVVYSVLTRSKIAIVYIMIFLAGIFACLPSGTKRMLSTVQIKEASIEHRLLLWRGACGLTAMQPYKGWEHHDCGKLYAQWFRPKQVTDNYRTMINDFLTISVKHGLLYLFPILIIIFALLWLSGHVACTLHDKLLAALVCSCLSYLISASFSTLYEYPEVFSWFLCLNIVTACYTCGLCMLNKFKFKLLDCFLPVSFAFLVCASIWIIGYFVNVSMSFRYFEYEKMSKDNNNTLILTAFPVHPPKALLVLYLPSTPLNVDENPYGLPSFRELLQNDYAIVSVALESGLQGFEISQFVLTKALKMANGLPVFTVGAGITGNYAILNSDGNAKRLGLSGFIGINASLDWPLEKLSPLNQICKIEVPGYLIDNKNLELDIFLKKAKLSKKTLVYRLLPEDSKNRNLIEKIDIATPLVLEHISLLLENPSEK